MWIVSGETFTGEVLTVSSEGYASIGHALMYGYPDALPQDVLVLVDEGTWLADYGGVQLPNAAFADRNIYIRGIGARASVIIDWKTQYNLNNTNIQTENCTVLCEGETSGVKNVLRYIDNWEAPSTILFNRCDIDAPDLGEGDGVFRIGGDNDEGTNISTILNLSYCEIETEADFIIYGVPVYGSYDISGCRITKTISPHMETAGTTGAFAVADYVARTGTAPVEEGEERFWVGNTGRWDQESHWALTSGGAGGASVPDGPDYEAIIDENSITLPGQYIYFPIVVLLELSANSSIAEISAPVTDYVYVAPVAPADISLSADNSIATITTPEVHNYATMGAVTFTTGTPGLVTTSGAHGLSENQPVIFTSTGTLPTEITARTTYFAEVIDATTFRTMVIEDGDLMDYTGTPSGTHTAFKEI